jgi:hypothetical protein
MTLRATSTAFASTLSLLQCDAALLEEVALGAPEEREQPT